MDRYRDRAAHAGDRVSAWTWAAVVLTGGFGAIGRFLLDSSIAGRAGRDFPYGTFVINITGALLLGLLVGLAVEENIYVIAGTATLGSYTTFSTWALESQRLAEDAEASRATVNLLLSLAVGFAAAALGHVIGAHA
jgi:CrcB protein